MQAEGADEKGVTVVYSRRQLVTTPELSHGDGEDIILTVTGSPVRSPRNNTGISSGTFCPPPHCIRGPSYQPFAQATYGIHAQIPVQNYHLSPRYDYHDRNRHYVPMNEEFQYMETYMEGSYPILRRKSVEELGMGSNMAGAPPPHRILDVHNLDPPPYWIPLHAMQPEKSSKGFLGLKRGGGHTFTEKLSQSISHHNKIRRSPQRIKREADASSIQYIDGSSPLDVNVAEASSYPDNLYPIYLPMDQAFKTKYVFATRKKRGKSLQERVYTLLEHPYGWKSFFYHFLV